MRASAIVDLAVIDVIDAAEQIEQRRLSRARRSHHGNEIAFGDSEVEMVEDRDRLLALGEALAHAGQANHRMFGCHCALLGFQFCARGPLADVASVAALRRKVTFTAMSGRMRGSFLSKRMRTRTVAFSRLAVGTIAITDAGMVQPG